ncbi:MAG TPA: hypothetical protein VEM15_11415 [Thermodesulfobacteriota bacterium]|nr:hypothetical protein [Thermodesulfobacteriota bacterium]
MRQAVVVKALGAAPPAGLQLTSQAAFAPEVELSQVQQVVM